MILDTGADTAQLDPPDTPAPVFAAKAFQRAIFGTPAPRDEIRLKVGANGPEAIADADVSGTPSKGILLTPGTGTARRKRVSFGHDVSNRERRPAKRSHTGSNTSIKRTRLNEVLEKSKKPSGANQKETLVSAAQKQENSDDEWEEEEGGDLCNHDVTVDLNEPHSQSGKFWKDEFEKYQQEAKTEMDKLLKYKQLAKSYAQQKDTEAIQLAVKLKDEQQKMIDMERKIAENTRKMMVNDQEGTSTSSQQEMLSKLAKQTASATQYRKRVQELEKQLENLPGDNGRGDRPQQQTHIYQASPRTQKTLLETSKELRRARSQAKELEQLRDQVRALKSDLRTARRPPKSIGNGDKVGNADSQGSRDLRSKLQQVREEVRDKDRELRDSKIDFETFKQESKQRETELKAVLERANTKIADLKTEIRSFKTRNPSGPEHQKLYGSLESDPVADVDQPGDFIRGPSIRRSRRLITRPEQNSHDLDDAMEYQVQTWGRETESRPEALRDEAVLKFPSALKERPNLERPRWQPFVPRSPRNKISLDNVEAAQPSYKDREVIVDESIDLAKEDLSNLARAVSKRKQQLPTGKLEATSDILQSRFDRLNGPEANNDGTRSRGKTSSATLPPERRAAARARVEQRMAEKKSRWTVSSDVANKENVRP